MSPTAPSLARASREFEPDEALFAGEDGLDAYRALAPQLPRLLNPGGLAAVEIGFDQAEAVTALACPRRACRRGSPTTSPVVRARCPANLGLNEIAWHWRLAALHQAGPGPLHSKMLSASVPPPTQSAVHFAHLAQTGTRGSGAAHNLRRPCPPEAKGVSFYCVRDVGI